MNWSVRLIEGEEFDIEAELADMTTLRAVLVACDDEDEGDEGNNGRVCGGVDVAIYHNATSSLSECARYNTIAQVGCIWDLSTESFDFLHAATFMSGNVRDEWRQRLGVADTVIVLSNLDVDEPFRHRAGATYLIRACTAMLPMPAVWVTSSSIDNTAATNLFKKTGFDRTDITDDAGQKDKIIYHQVRSTRTNNTWVSSEADQSNTVVLVPKKMSQKTGSPRSISFTADNSFSTFCRARLSRDAHGQRTPLRVIKRHYREWCANEGRCPMVKSQIEMSTYLRALGFEVVNCKNRRSLKGSVHGQS